MLIKSWIQNLWTVWPLRAKQTRPRYRRASLRYQAEFLEVRVLLTAPTIVSLDLNGPALTNANTVSWTATFSEPVTGVDPTDFALVKTGSVGSTLSQISGSGSVYQLTVSGITGSGTLGLNLIDNDSIQNTTSDPLGGSGIGNANFTGQVATLDHVFPTVTSIVRTNPAVDTTNATSVIFTANFSKPVTGVDLADFTLIQTGSVSATITQVTGSNSSYSVTVSITGLGFVGLNLVDNGSVHDLAGNPLTSTTFPTSFSTQSTFATGTHPFTVVMSDLNGDGNPDLAIANSQDYSVSVLLGNGDGTFQAQQTFDAGPFPYTVVTSDLNGDGKPDLIVADSTGSTVGVLLGNGDGTFGPPQTFEAGNSPYAIAAADVNGDGRPDLAVANFLYSTVTLLLGTPEGLFLPGQTIGTGSLPVSVVLGDVNGDGKPDLIVASRGGYSLGVYLGNGDGTFGSPSTFATGSCAAVQLGDVNGDGKPDLVNANTNQGTVSVLLGNGDGTFQQQHTFAAQAFPYSISIADMNGDGKPDLTVANFEGNTVSLLVGNGDGTFADQLLLTTGTKPASVVTGDVNKDGRPDVAVVNEISNTAGIFLGTANGDFTGQAYKIAELPTITSPTTATIAARSVTLGGTVTADGGDTISERGIVYAPTSVNPNPQLGGTGVIKVVASGTVGAFTADVTGLLSGTDYSFAAYATNKIGTAYTSPVSTFVTINAPVVYDVESFPLSYKANDPAFPPQPISNTVAITDPDSNNLVMLTVQITSGYQNDINGHDVLGFTNKYGITGSFDAATGTMTLTGSAYVGDYREALRTVTFSSSGTNVSSATRTLTIIATDDKSPIAGVSLPATRQVTVSTANVGPTLLGIPVIPVEYVQGANPVNVAPAATVVDPDSLNLVFATVQISGNYQTGLDRLWFTAEPGITGTFNSDVGTLTLSGIASLASYERALRSVTYYTTSLTGSTLTRTLTFVLNDGLINSEPVTRDIHVTAYIFPPVVYDIEPFPLAYKANDPAFPPQPISNTVAITDPDTNDLIKLTVQITSGYQNDANGHDILGFTDKYGITGSFDAATGTMTLSGSAYVGNYREALRTVTFSTSGSNVSTANRTLTIIATDDQLPVHGVSVPVTRQVTVSTANVGPTLLGIPVIPVEYVQGADPVNVAPGATIVDPDSLNLAFATVQISANYQTGLDRLWYTAEPGITGSFNSDAGTLTLSGIASLASYERALRSVTYYTSSMTGSTLTRTLTFVLNDGILNSEPVTRDIHVTAYVFPPLVYDIEPFPLPYKANDPAFPPQPISNTVAITDVDSNNLVKLTVQITSGYQNNANGHDILGFTDQFGITGSFDAATGTMTLSGLAYVGDYREALRTVTFSTSGNNVSRATRTLTIIATDDKFPTPGVSVPATRDVTVMTIAVS